MPGRTVAVPPERLLRWFENFATRHGEVDLTGGDGALTAAAEDGSVAQARLPFGAAFDGQTLANFVEAASNPRSWGLLLVRRGGFAVATVRDDQIVASKVGQRHVQGQTKAGGWSQQRYARRRDNQARAAYTAAADHAARVLDDSIDVLVCGGDRPSVDAVLDDPRLTRLSALRVDPWLAVPDPKRAVLNQAVADGRSAYVTITDPA